jgi:predicted AlkP superfamily phosphohydrolase/phosphomutase
MRSPALWTTVATGRPRSVHGIYDFVTDSRYWPEELRSAERNLVTGDMRQVPALWDVVGDAGGDVAVVGWLNTWPAEQVRGVMVAPYVAMGDRKQSTIKGTLYADEENQVWPQQRWAEVRQGIVSSDDVSQAQVGRFVRPDPGVVSLFPILGRYEAGLKWSISHTLTMGQTMTHLLSSDSPNLAMVYFEGADSLGHRFWLMRESPERIESALKELDLPSSAAGRLKEAYGSVIEEYYKLFDAQLGRLLQAAGPEMDVVVISDHGFGSRTGLWPRNPAVPFTGEHSLEGFIAMAGPDVDAGGEIFGATLYDIAPTILSLLGLDVPDEMEGAPLRVTTESATRRSVSREPDESLSSEELSRLQSLGYIQ